MWATEDLEFRDLSVTTDVIHLWTTLIPDPYQCLQKNRMEVIYVWVMGSIPLVGSGAPYSLTVALRNWCRARMCFIHFDEHVHVGEWMRDRTAWSDEAGYGKSLWPMTTFWRIEWDWTFFGLQMSWLMIPEEAIRIRHWWIWCFKRSCQLTHTWVGLDIFFGILEVLCNRAWREIQAMKVGYMEVLHESRDKEISWSYKKVLTKG